MNFFSAHFSKKKPLQPSTVGQPVPVPDVQVTSPQEPAPISPKRRKRLAIVPPERDVSRLQKCLHGGASPPSSASSGASPRPPSSPSPSAVSAGEKRLRRSSTRSLELLRTAQEQGQLPNWDSLPPSPMFVDTPLSRSLMRWGTEAAAAQEKDQRLRIAQQMVRVSREREHTLVIQDAPLVTELPQELGKLAHLKRLEVRHVGVKTLPDLSELLQLEALIISHCPQLRTMPHGLSKRAPGLRVELEELPQLRDSLRRLAAAEVVRRGRPWQQEPPEDPKGKGVRKNPGTRLLPGWL